MRRRRFIEHITKAGLGFCAGPFVFNSLEGTKFKVSQITGGPKQHWFGYYDKWQVDPTGRYALGMEVDLFFHSPRPQDVVKIGVIDLKRNNEWRQIGSSRAWGWQQGCMLQWIPDSEEEVIWNDREGDRFVSRIMNIKTGKQRTLPKPIYALSPGGDFAIGTAFNRIQNMRPGYGYAGIPDPHEQVQAPEEIGIYKLDLETGKHELLISLDQVAAIPHQGRSVMDNWHYFNHLLVSPDGERFIFLHRWREKMGERASRALGGFTTRMFTAGKDGGDLYILDPSGHTSHFIWRDPDHVCAWTRPRGKKAGFYLFTDQTDKIEIVGEQQMTQNGHNTYVPHTNDEWILNDTYPQGTERLQTLYLYHVPTRRKVILGQFHEPEKFKGEWRCDLHPRCDQQGRRVFFDSTHKAGKRQMHMIDIADIVQ